MFVCNKYSKWYYSIISNAKRRINNSTTYTENHHIIPRSLGGSNQKENIVTLTAKEHFICHLLLVRFTVDSARQKMKLAAFMLAVTSKNQQRQKVNSRWYAILREEYAKAKTGVKVGPFSEERKKNISKAKKGKPLSEMHKQALTGIKKGRPWNDARRKSCRKVMTPFGLYYSMAEAERALGLGPNSIAYRIKTKPDEFYFV